MTFRKLVKIRRGDPPKMKISMNGRSYASTFMALFLLVAAVLACSSGNETEKANKLVDEGNAAVTEGKKYVTEAEEKKAKMLETPVADLAEARTLAKEAIAAYDKAAAKCKDAASKYED